MPLYMIERTFAEELELTGEDIQLIEEVNADEGVRWLFSFLSADRRRTYCLYEAPSSEAIVAAARRANIPADEVVEVQADAVGVPGAGRAQDWRSEERRVGKECRTRGGACHSSRRRHTRYWRDWSSDVCSSDLRRPLAVLIPERRSQAYVLPIRGAFLRGDRRRCATGKHSGRRGRRGSSRRGRGSRRRARSGLEIGRASCRERV